MLFTYVVVGNEIGVMVFGPVHGALSVGYLVIPVLAARRLHWGGPPTVLALVAGVPPLFTLWFER